MKDFFKNLNRIEYVITYACTGRCKHCSEGDHVGKTEHIKTDAAVRALVEVAGKYKIESVMTFGGEPLLYSETVFAIHKKATELKIEKRQLITNGFFSTDEKRIFDVAENLALSGVNDLLLSADAFHQETIPKEPVLTFAKAVKSFGVPIRMSPAWLVSETDDNLYNVKTREILSEFSDHGIVISSGNIIFPSGNAKKYLNEYFDGETDPVNPYEEDPYDVRSISFDPDGGLFGENIYGKSVLEILENYKP